MYWHKDGSELYGLDLSRSGVGLVCRATLIFPSNPNKDSKFQMTRPSGHLEVHPVSLLQANSFHFGLLRGEGR